MSDHKAIPAHKTTETTSPQKEIVQTPQESTPLSPEKFLTPANVVRLQRYIGNSGVRRLLKSEQERMPIQRTLKLPPVASLQREGDAAAPDAANTNRSVTVDGESINTYEQAASWYSTRIMKLMGLQQDFTQEVAAPGDLKEAITVGKAQMGVCSGLSGQMEDQDLNMLEDWCKQFITSHNGAERVMVAQTIDRMNALKEKATALDTAVNQNMGPLRDLQRALFRKEDENKLLGIADAIAGVLDCSLAAKGTIEQIDEVVQAFKPWKINMNTLELLPPSKSMVPKVLNVLENANKAYAAFQVLRAAVDVIGGGGVTKAAGQLGAIKAVATIASAGGTLLGCSATFGLYANLYMGPAVDACLKLAGVILDYRSTYWNHSMIQMGNLNAVNWSLEPGGRPMFDFMLRVMKAGDSSGVPQPVPKMVADYFVANQDKFNAGVGFDEDKNAEAKKKKYPGDAGGAMPVTGWIWQDVDPKRIARWVFNNRANLWGMFYGSLPVP